MKLFSKVFKDNQIINDEKYSAYGQNFFPGFSWSDFPADTKSFALFCHDKDAPIASGFWHLQIVDIPLSETSISEGKLKTGGLIRNNDADQANYIGPRPPIGSGLHEYRFTVYALPFASLGEFKKSLGMDHSVSSSRAYAAFVVELNKLDSASIAFKYEKK